MPDVSRSSTKSRPVPAKRRRAGRRPDKPSILAVTRARWLSARPFEGHTVDSLLHKVDSPALKETVREAILRELRHRGYRMPGAEPEADPALATT